MERAARGEAVSPRGVLVPVSSSPANASRANAAKRPADEAGPSTSDPAARISKIPKGEGNEHARVPARRAALPAHALVHAKS